ncbi:putative sugar phosphate/phosphate translocator [Cucumis melo var. makuwa]|uniref:Putative sugar phosphate/phosphate translocator n=1 Tax=Cucumis melo var. makuwa TaxID=1194695 RepID=A0A5D3CWV5_CUCMM|nr:putative sugar phosphate/phosphate translocator [Cucumis melo var. makuwa]
MVMEVLSRLLNKPEKVNLTHLTFADDLMIFSAVDEPSLSFVRETLQKFGELSSLFANLGKSSIFVVSNEVASRLAASLDIALGNLPVRYLGLPLLSDRLQLVCSVLHSLQVYWASVFVLPASVHHEVDKILRWLSVGSVGFGVSRLSYGVPFFSRFGERVLYDAMSQREARLSEFIGRQGGFSIVSAWDTIRPRGGRVMASSHRIEYWGVELSWICLQGIGKDVRRKMWSVLWVCMILSSGSNLAAMVSFWFSPWVLSSKEINFPYPLALTLLHMIFSSILCFILIKVFKVLKIEEGMSAEMYATSVIPIGATFAMTLWLGNTAYLYISVAFAQMLKAIMPVAVFVLGVAAGLELMSCRMLLIMSVISFGVLVASYGEINISWIGVVYQMGGVVGEALRLIFMEILVKRKGLKLNPISIMYYVSPCSALCLLIPWIFLEKPKMEERESWNFPPVILVLNSLCTFALNLSVFLVITHTSALTIRVAGVVKDWVVVLLSALLFADVKLTVINLFGYGIAIAGVVAYNNHKLKKEASRRSPNDSDQLESIPMVTSSSSNK